MFGVYELDTKKITRELGIVIVGGLIEGFAEGIDDGNPVEVELVLGWLDGDAGIEGFAEVTLCLVPPPSRSSTSLSAERMTRGAGGELAFLAVK